jgi:hypothetical protein
MPEKIYNELRVDNFVLEGDMLYCKLDTDTLRAAIEELRIEAVEYSSQLLEGMLELVQFLLSNGLKKIAEVSMQ